MAIKIHPTAVIEAGAEIGEECIIGAFCVIGSNVRLGARTRLHDHVVVDGRTTVGSDCQFYSFACIGKQTQDLKYDGGTTYIKIGNNTTLREYVTVHSATIDGASTIIGNNCNILAYSHVAHDCILGDNIIISNCAQIAGHVTIEDNVVFGGMVGVHQFVRIGKMAMISATSKVVQDILPFSLADGNPAACVTINKIGMQRNGIEADEIQAVNRAYKKLFRANITVEDAINQLQEEYKKFPAVHYLVEFAKNSERGMARPKKKK